MKPILENESLRTQMITAACFKTLSDFVIWDTKESYTRQEVLDLIDETIKKSVSSAAIELVTKKCKI